MCRGQYRPLRAFFGLAWATSQVQPSKSHGVLPLEKNRSSFLIKLDRNLIKLDKRWFIPVSWSRIKFLDSLDQVLNLIFGSRNLIPKPGSQDQLKWSSFLVTKIKLNVVPGTIFSDQVFRSPDQVKQCLWDQLFNQVPWSHDTRKFKSAVKKLDTETGSQDQLSNQVCWSYKTTYDQVWVPRTIFPYQVSWSAEQ